jgi:hypothetical protein
VTSTNDANLNTQENSSPEPLEVPDYQYATLSATYVIGTSLSGTITYPASNTYLSLPLQFVANSTQAASLSAIAGTYTGTFYAAYSGSYQGELDSGTFTISSTGVLSGSFTPNATYLNNSNPKGCTVTGTVTARTDINAYNFTYTFSDTTPAGVLENCESALLGYTATGYGYYNSQTTKLTVGAIDPTQSYAFNFMGTS